MSGRGPRRRLRIRRKRKRGGAVRESAENAAGEFAIEVAGDVAGEVVYQTGWCLLEAVVSAWVVLALLTIPAYLLLTRVT